MPRVHGDNLSKGNEMQVLLHSNRTAHQDEVKYRTETKFRQDFADWVC